MLERFSAHPLEAQFAKTLTQLRPRLPHRSPRLLSVVFLRFFGPFRPATRISLNPGAGFRDLTKESDRRLVEKFVEGLESLPRR